MTDWEGPVTLEDEEATASMEALPDLLSEEEE